MDWKSVEKTRSSWERDEPVPMGIVLGRWTLDLLVSRLVCQMGAPPKSPPPQRRVSVYKRTQE